MAYLDAYLRANGATGIQHGENHQIWCIPFKLFNTLPIKKWKFNRDPDPERVAEIQTHIKTSNRVDGVIQLAVVNNEMVCYESNHRREALKGVDECADILVDIMWQATDDILKEEFFRLNKAVSVAELYLAKEPIASTVDLIAARDAFCKKYAALKSTSQNPHRPAFNPESILNDLLDITTKNQLTVDDAMTKIDALNEKMSHRDRKKLRPAVIEKCEKSGLWLFAWDRHINPREVV
jgi:hypothetical protein